MSELYQTIEYRGYNINIKYDYDPESPREAWENLGTIYSNHRNYSPDNKSIEDLTGQECYQDDNGNFDTDKFGEDYIWMPIYAYIHSGITVSCRRHGIYRDRWDSGLFGIIAVEKSAVMKEYGYKEIGEKERKVIECYLEGEIQTLDSYYTGEVYGYTITKVDDTGNEEEYDSCWGYYGDDNLKHIEEECKSLIDNFIKNERKERIAYLRQRIREKGRQLCLPFLDCPQINPAV